MTILRQLIYTLLIILTIQACTLFQSKDEVVSTETECGEVEYRNGASEYHHGDCCINGKEF